jgi:hypothetical protein
MWALDIQIPLYSNGFLQAQWTRQVLATQNSPLQRAGAANFAKKKSGVVVMRGILQALMELVHSEHRRSCHLQQVLRRLVWDVTSSAAANLVTVFNKPPPVTRNILSQSIPICFQNYQRQSLLHCNRRWNKIIVLLKMSSAVNQTLKEKIAIKINLKKYEQKTTPERNLHRGGLLYFMDLNQLGLPKSISVVIIRRDRFWVTAL